VIDLAFLKPTQNQAPVRARSDEKIRDVVQQSFGLGCIVACRGEALEQLQLPNAPLFGLGNVPVCLGKMALFHGSVLGHGAEHGSHPRQPQAASRRRRS